MFCAIQYTSILAMFDLLPNETCNPDVTGRVTKHMLEQTWPPKFNFGLVYGFMSTEEKQNISSVITSISVMQII